jgi:hypothetical protein
MHFLILLASSLLPVLTLASPAAKARDTEFNPSAIPLQHATCPGINRAENKTVDLQLGLLPTVAFS